jgi:hypothetical protein
VHNFGNLRFVFTLSAAVAAATDDYYEQKKTTSTACSDDNIKLSVIFCGGQFSF